VFSPDTALIKNKIYNKAFVSPVVSEVDMVLLGGDLFHENKPSRLAEKKCISILRKHVLGDRPIALQVPTIP
jgi:double-strand break repair protein MRE11